jgi:hypothetical protein
LFPRDTCDRSLLLTVPGGHLEREEERALDRALRRAATSEGSRAALAEAIGTNAARNGLVGPDSMTVILEPARFPHIPVALITADPPATVHVQVGESVPEHYSPLLVRAGMRVPPMLLAGKQSLHFGPFLIDYDPPIGKGNVAMVWEVQRREPRPRPR